jgi:two-component system, NarL family, response regulator NreC
MIRVIIADDHVMVRQGIRCLLEHAHDIDVLAEAQNGQEAIDLCKQYTPDVLVIDVSMPRLNGIQAVEQICGKHDHHRTHAIMLSMYDDTYLVQRSLRAGANGYVLKSQNFSELLEAIRTVSQSGIYLSPSIRQSLLDLVITGKFTPDEDGPFEHLTVRERELLKLIAEGNSNQEMADLLQISIKTIQKHRANLVEKLDVHSAAGLTYVAIKHGLVLMDN